MRPKSFSKFINNCFIEHNIGNLYNVVSNLDYDTGVIVDACPDKGWSVKHNEYFDIDTEDKLKRLFDVVEESEVYIKTR